MTTSGDVHDVHKSILEMLKDAPDPETRSITASAALSTMVAEVAAQLAEARVPLRDQFAMAAMQGDFAKENGIWTNSVPGPIGDEKAARFYYGMADAMMKVREEKKESPDAE